MGNWNNKNNWNKSNDQREYEEFQRWKRSGGSSPKQEPKRSGAKFTTYKNGRFANTDLVHIHAWRKTKGGIEVLSMNPLDGTEHIGRVKGKTHIVYIGELINQQTKVKQTVLGMYCKETRKLTLNDYPLVVSENGSGLTSSGKVAKGYFGGYTVKNNYRK